MNAPVRLDKKATIELVTQFVPGYLEILRECRDATTWRKLSDKFRELTTRLNIRNYVLLYDDERRIHQEILNAFMSAEDQQAWAKELEAMSPEELQEQLRVYGRPGGTMEQLADLAFPDDPEIEKQQAEAFQRMDEQEKQTAIKHSQYLFAAFLAILHDALAVMVHGERMTALVPKALAGNMEAFEKAIHIDKNLIVDHPGFKDRHARALREGDATLIERIAYRVGSPVTRGRIRLAGAFILFALLETLHWLGEFKHREILDIADAANLDRFQNRLEDESAVAKCLAKYHRYQKTGGVSMH